MSTILTANREGDVSDIEAVSENNVTLFDPQVQFELEHLNAATDHTKKLEAELDKARSEFRCLLSESSSKVNSLSKKLGSCVEKAKKCREVGIEIRKLLAEAENTNELENERMLDEDEESEKVVKQLQQQLKKSINKSCLSTRRNLLQLNNLANQHQLQLLPYFEMKAQFIKMFEEQIKKVPPFSDFKTKINDVDTQFQLEKSIDYEIHQQYRFEDLLEHEKRDEMFTKTSNSVTSSYQDSLSSENLFLELLTSEDTYMALPPNLKPTPDLINCTVSSGNCYFKSSNHRSTDEGSFVDDLISKISHKSFSYKESNGFQHDEKTLNHFSNSNHHSTDEGSSAGDLISHESFSYIESNGFQHDTETLKISRNANYSHSTDEGSFVDDVISKSGLKSFSCVESNGFRHEIETLMQSSNAISNNIENEVSEISGMLTKAKSSDSESSISNLNCAIIHDELSDSEHEIVNDPANMLDNNQI